MRGDEEGSESWALSPTPNVKNFILAVVGLRRDSKGDFY